jgi:hypothetical protein
VRFRSSDFSASYSRVFATSSQKSKKIIESPQKLDYDLKMNEKVGRGRRHLFELCVYCLHDIGTCEL